MDLARDVFAVWTRPVPPSERLHDTPPAIRVRSALAFVGALLAAVVLAGAASWGAALRMGAGT